LGLLLAAAALAAALGLHLANMLLLALPAALLTMAAALGLAAAPAAAVGLLVATVVLAPFIWRAIQASSPDPAQLLLALAAIAAWALAAWIVAAARRRVGWWALLIVPVAMLGALDIGVNARRGLEPVVRESIYITARDNVRLAADIYRPRHPDAGAHPAILTVTRYQRSPAFIWPLSLLLDEIQAPVTRIIDSGYVWVVVDARGAGASFGTRTREWAEDEIKDGDDIAAWIVAQPWSSGAIGLDGNSYSATWADFFLARRHPAVKAAIPRFGLVDSYEDIAFPGGVRQSEFLRLWARANAILDADAGVPYAPAWYRYLVGVRPVDADRDRSLLRAALAEHARNYDLEAGLAQVTYRDDHAPGGWTLEEQSPYRVAEAGWRGGVPVYSWSGWFDGGYPRAAVARFNASGPGSRLILGPWTHGGTDNVSPHARGPEPFDLIGEILAFYDLHLKARPTRLAKAPPVQYFMMGAEEWRSDTQWPPRGSALKPFHFTPARGLESAAPQLAGELAYTVDETATSGLSSRWLALLGSPDHNPHYPDRAGEDRKLLSFTSPPLDNPVEIAGDPVVHLHLASTAPDGYFFAYLEEVTADGRVLYVTEGMLRALHRKVSPAPPPYPRLGPHHSFLRQDGETMAPGETAEIAFDLQPVAYRFAAGSRIRVALAGADAGHVSPITATPPTWRVRMAPDTPSRIELPIIGAAP
jgi:putative CocE/NonD family hydrolase